MTTSGQGTASHLLAHGHHALVDAVLGRAGDRTGAVHAAADVTDSVASDLPTEGIRDGLRWASREVEALVDHGPNQLGNGLPSMLGEVQGERVAQFDSAEFASIGHDRR